MEEFLEGLRNFVCDEPDPSEIITEPEQWYKELGIDAPCKGRFWITNGTEARIIAGEIPDGWWKGRIKMSDETRARMSASHTGKPKPHVANSNRRREVTEETRAKMKRNHKGNMGRKFKSPATSLSNMGRKWYNNGKVNKFCYECPPGFEAGMLQK
jgi:hypothetical protein